MKFYYLIGILFIAFFISSCGDSTFVEKESFVDTPLVKVVLPTPTDSDNSIIERLLATTECGPTQLPEITSLEQDQTDVDIRFEEIQTFKYGQPIEDIIWLSGDKGILIFGVDGQIKLWNPQNDSIEEIIKSESYIGSDCLDCVFPLSNGTKIGPFTTAYY